MYSICTAGFAVLAAVAVGAASAAVAQQVNAPAAKEKKDPSAALNSYESGTKAFEAGKIGSAISSLSAALSSGGLPAPQMAKALYYRGAAYRSQGKPAQAISDLTTAIWLKGGLSDSDRTAATEQRKAAYREAGLGDNPVPVAAAPLDAPATAAASASPAATSITSSWGAQTSDQSAARASIPTLGTLAAASAAPAASPSASPPSPVASFSSSAPDVPSLSALLQELTDAPVASGSLSPPLAGAGTAVSNVGQSIGNFFGGLFGGTGSGVGAGTQATTEGSSAFITSSTAPEPAATVAAGDWDSQTSVDSPDTKSKPVSSPSTSPSASGKFRLQVAALRSRAEAERVAKGLQKQHGAALSGAVPEIDEAVFGNMGTFYRVRVGSYASAAEPGKLCNELRPQGYDCLVVSQ